MKVNYLKDLYEKLDSMLCDDKCIDNSILDLSIDIINQQARVIKELQSNACGTKDEVIQSMKNIIDNIEMMQYKELDELYIHLRDFSNKVVNELIIREHYRER